MGSRQRLCGQRANAASIQSGRKRSTATRPAWRASVAGRARNNMTRGVGELSGKRAYKHATGVQVVQLYKCVDVLGLQQNQTLHTIRNSHLHDVHGRGRTIGARSSFTNTLIRLTKDDLATSYKTSHWQSRYPFINVGS